MQSLTPKRVARAIGVSESSLKRWCDSGLIATSKTAGGHRRISLSSVVEFLRSRQYEVVQPELLGLPATIGKGPRVVGRAQAELCDALIAGDEQRCRQILFDLHLAGQPISVICDDVVAHAFHVIGDRWDCQEVDIYQERRGCEVCMRALYELGGVLSPADSSAPLALGATPWCDPYTLPTIMAELVLRQNGWQSQSLGSRLPFDTLAAAADRHQPQLFWLSVSHIEAEAEFIEVYNGFYDAIGSKAAVVVGGRGLTENIRRQIRYAAYCDNLQHLESFAGTLHNHSLGELVRASEKKER